MPTLQELSSFTADWVMVGHSVLFGPNYKIDLDWDCLSN